MAIRNGGRGKQRQAMLPAYPERPCAECGGDYRPYKIDQRYCAPTCQRKHLGRRAYLRRHGKLPDRERECGVCGQPFPRLDHYDWRRRYCSGECSKEAKRRARRAFHDRNPDYRARAEKVYNSGGWSSSVTRFFKRCPNVPRACAVCGESRVVDIHHRERRRGVPTSAANSQCSDVWVLCPNHHAMIHRGVATAEGLGLA